MNSLEDDYGLFKWYVVLYTCASTRGAALELVPDANSKNFVYSFRRFIARKGFPGENWAITWQSLPLKKLKTLLQAETLAGNLAWLMHHGMEVFGKGLFPL